MNKLVCAKELVPNLKQKNPNEIIIKYNGFSHKTSIFFDKNCFWSGMEIFLDGITFEDYSAYEAICDFFTNNNSFNTLDRGMMSSRFSRIV